LEEVANTLNEEMKVTIKLEKERREQEFVNFKKQQEKTLRQLTKKQEHFERRIKNVKQGNQLHLSSSVGVQQFQPSEAQGSGMKQ
jgi:hypothetical protein